MTLGERIKLRRKELGLTQVQLGEMVHKSSQVVSNWERGYTTAMSPEDLLNIAQALNVNISELMDNPAPAQPPAQKPELNARDERDIQKKLQSILDDLDPDTGLAFYNGQEPMDNETRDLIRSSIENSLRTAKQLAKTKYTPKKYRNE
ncbi:helix-turn-helix transcriptional regulator [Mitsuokella jalaludinii]|uniref:helix-turn-helix domain-containing protein n=1 Tax=Mitsuokella jalaludinii TaxID=187979 RepID=UPI00307830F2